MFAIKMVNLFDMHWHQVALRWNFAIYFAK
jgi:hypothetical protein